MVRLDLLRLADAPCTRLRKHAHTSRDRQRFYLLPGMGGSALKRKRQLFMRWSLATGAVVSLLVAYLLYYISRQ